MIKNYKDPLEILSLYSDCISCYIGLTNRSLRTSVKECIFNIKLHFDTQNINSQHSFDWQNENILDADTGFDFKIISETLYIKSVITATKAQTNSMEHSNNYDLTSLL